MSLERAPDCVFVILSWKTSLGKDFEHVVEEILQDTERDIRAVVLTGAGKYFSVNDSSPYPSASIALGLHRV